MIKIIAQIKKHRYWLGLLLVLVSAALVYSNCLRVGWLNWDDGEQVYLNRDIATLSWPATIKIFKSFYLGMYQPLATASYALEYHFAQDRPWLYHLDNLLLHLGNIILVWLLTKQIFKKNNLALLSAAIFAIHPLTLESVIWVSARSTLLFVGWYLLALIFYNQYLKSSRARYYWLVCLCFLLSLTSKTLAVTLPLALLLFDYYHRRKINKKLILEKIPLLALSVAFGLIAMKARHTYFEANQESYVYSWPNRIITWLYSLGDYIEKIIVPSHLSTYYARPEQINGWLPWNFYLVAGGFLLLLILLIKFRAKKTLIFLGLFYLLNLVLTVQIKFFSHTIIADRYAYLAGLAVIWLLAIIYVKIVEAKPRYKNIINIIVVIYLLLLSVITVNRTELWQNNYIFWQRVIDQYPNDSFALSAMGGAYYEFKDYDQALAVLEKSIKIDNKNSEAFNRLGTIYFGKNNFKQAIDYYNKAIMIDNTKAVYYYNRGCAINGLGDLSGTLFDYELAVKNSKSDDQYFDIYYLVLANTKYKLRDYAGAIMAYDQAIALAKNPAEAYLFRGLSKLNLKNKIEGCQDVIQADKLGYENAKEEISKLCQ
jgi:tetratricopeptide (TPR) repeat protein